VSETENFPFIVDMSSNEKKMKKQPIVFSVDKKMQVFAKVDAHLGTQVDLAAFLGLAVYTLNTTVSKLSEIEESYLPCGPSFSE
jgi:hypothetical protein